MSFSSQETSQIPGDNNHGDLAVSFTDNKDDDRSAKHKVKKVLSKFDHKVKGLSDFFVRHPWARAIDLFSFSPHPRHEKTFSTFRGIFWSFIAIAATLVYVGLSFSRFTGSTPNTVTTTYVLPTEAGFTMRASDFALKMNRMDALARPIPGNFFDDSYFRCGLRHQSIYVQDRKPREIRDINFVPCDASAWAGSYAKEALCPNVTRGSEEDELRVSGSYATSVYRVFGIHCASCSAKHPYKNLNMNGSDVICADKKDVFSTLIRLRISLLQRFHTGGDPEATQRTIDMLYLGNPNSYSPYQSSFAKHTVTVGPDLLTSWSTKTFERVDFIHQRLLVSAYPSVPVPREPTNPDDTNGGMIFLSIDHVQNNYDVLESRTFLSSLDAIGSIFAFNDAIMTILSLVLVSKTAEEFYKGHPNWVLDDEMTPVNADNSNGSNSNSDSPPRNPFLKKGVKRRPLDSLIGENGEELEGEEIVLQEEDDNDDNPPRRVVGENSTQDMKI